MIALAAIAAVSGCRDGRFHDGSRISDRHVIASRPASRGGPRLTSAELTAGSFVSYDRDLDALETGLRDGIGGSLAITAVDGSGPNDIRGLLRPAWRAGLVTVFDPTRVIGEGRGALVFPLGNAILPLSFAAMRAEHIALCNDPFVGEFFPRDDEGSCDVLNIDKEVDFAGLNLSDFLESATFSIQSNNIGVRWVRPSEFLNQRVSFGATPGGPLAGFCTPPCDTSCPPVEVCRLGYTCPPDITVRTRCQQIPCITDANCADDPQGLPWTHATCDTRSGRCIEFTQVSYTSDAEPKTTPVLEVTVPFTVDTDFDNTANWLLGRIVIDTFAVHYRFQPTVCDPVTGCEWTREPLRDPETRSLIPQPSHLAYRGASPDGDVAARRANVQVNAVAVGDVTVHLRPGAGLVALCLIPYTTSLCVRAILRANSGAERALSRMGKATGPLMDGLVSGRRLDDPGPVPFDVAKLTALCGASAGGTCPLNAAALDNIHTWARFNVGEARVSLPPLRGRVRPAFELGGANGEFTNTTIVALSTPAQPTALNARIESVVIDTSQYTIWCLPGGTCRDWVAEPECNVCRECGTPEGAAHPFCQFARTPIALPSLFFPMPSAPVLSRVMDSLGNISKEVRGIFTRPIEDAPGIPRIYASIDVCPSPTVPASECPALAESGGGVAARFTLGSDDTDLDGIDDVHDNCLGVSNPDQEDIDGDRVGDVCDNCPCTPTATQDNRNGDLEGDACDDDVDGDGCFNAYLVAPTACVLRPPQENPAGAVREDQRIFDTELADDGSYANTDGDALVGADALIDDCDPDDDGDGILDDGNGDGLGVYTPCPRGGALIDCDDNCEDVVNADQLDRGGLPGVGDVCEGPLGDVGAIPAPFERPASSGPGSMFTPQCLGDGPGCWGFAVGQCLSLAGGCGDTSDFYDVFDSSGARFARLSPNVALGSASVPMADLDGDGRQELVVGAPKANAGAGRVLALGSRDGAVLFELAGARAGDGFGSALVVAGNVLFVGAPGARDETGALTGAVSRCLLGGIPYPDGAFYGKEAGDEFGRSLSVVGDGEVINGLLVGAPGAKIAGADDAGRIEARGLRGARLGDFALGVAGARLGASAGAVLPNAFKDPGGVLAAMPDAVGGRGVVAFFNWSGGVMWQVEGAPGERLGASLAFAADFDLDGRAEVAVGAPGAMDGRGRVYVADSRGFFQTFFEGADGDALGARVAATGDLDHDGAVDLTIGLADRPSAPGRFDGMWVLLPGVGGKDPNLPPAPGEIP